MKKKLIKMCMTSRSKILSLVSAMFFLIGSLYYSYIHIRSAYAGMCEVKPKELSDGSRGYVLEFSFSNINAATVFSIMLVLIMCASTVLLIVFALKNKYHILSVVFSAAIIALQFVLKEYTLLQEFMFARYVLDFGTVSYDIGILIKYIPFVIALILSVVCFAVAMLSHKPQIVGELEEVNTNEQL